MAPVDPDDPPHFLPSITVLLPLPKYFIRWRNSCCHLSSSCLILVNHARRQRALMQESPQRSKLEVKLCPSRRPYHEPVPPTISELTAKVTTTQSIVAQSRKNHAGRTLWILRAARVRPFETVQALNWSTTCWDHSLARGKLKLGCQK